VEISNPYVHSSSEARVNPGYLEDEAEKITNLTEFSVRKTLVVYMPQESEELRLCNLLYNLTNPNPIVK
jgi:hypothetical protein